jgi:translation initiation factor IF-2
MSKVRVYEVAKQLNMDQKALVALFQSMGFGDVKNHMSSVEPDVVERVKRHIERQKTPDVVEERIRPTVVKRRARAEHGAEVAEGRPAVPAPPASSPTAALDAAIARAVPSAPPSHAGERVVPPAPTSTIGRRKAPEAPPPVDVAPEPPPPVVEAAPPPAPPVAPPPQPSAPVAAEKPAVAAAVAPQVAPERAPSEPPPAKPEPAVRATKPRAPATEEPRGATPPPPPSAPRAAIAPPPPPAEEVAPVVVAAPPAPPPPPPAPPVVVEKPAAAAPPPAPVAAPAPSAAPAAAGSPSAAPRRPSTAPKTGIDVWQGRPGVPMPQVQTRSGPPARRTTYDPRASQAPARPGGPGGYAGGPGGRPMGGMQRGRPGFRPRPGQGGPQMRRPGAVSTQEMSSHKKVVKIEEQVSLQQLAAKMSLKAVDVLMRLLSMGMTGVNINSTLDAETAKILASEFGWQVEDVSVSEEASLADAMGQTAEVEDGLEPRPPIVTVMGHVDHGKTSLLDKIRKAAVAEGEAGGITQHIGAYRVETSRGTIAFLDTPGHEAFTAMRQRGASLTDIVILVVAADDGVMPQTREAVNHAQQAKVPIVVAVNKIDKPGADPEKIMRDLASFGLQSEEWGGDTMFVKVSAKTGQGVEQLLETVLLQAEVLELKANAKKRAQGTVIEALLDRGRGPVARVMVQDGTLHVGDILLAGAAWGKVRAMTDELGRAVAQAGPATPVEVLGLNEVPSAGDPVHSVKDARTAEEIAETRHKKVAKSLVPQDARMSLEALTTRLSEADTLELKLIIKGDVQGSVEAVANALTKLSTQKVKVTIVHAGVGAITEGDVNLAVASKAMICGFNVRAAGKANSLAESEKVEIRTYNIIYNAVDDIRSAMEALLPATKVEKQLGKAEVRAVFRIAKSGTVAGCMVIEGLVKRTTEARLFRGGVVIWSGKLSGLRRFKDDAREVAEGFECGISLDGFQDVKEGDVIESFEIEEIKTKLS